MEFHKRIGIDDDEDKDDKNVVIKRADKDSCVAIWDRTSV